MGAVESDEGHDQGRRRAEHRVTPRDPTGDHRFWGPVALEIPPPRGADPGQQRPLRGRLVECDEEPRTRVVGSGRGAGGTDRLLDRVARDSIVTERADRSASVQRLERRFAEEIVGGCPDQVAAASCRALPP